MGKASLVVAVIACAGCKGTEGAAQDLTYFPGAALVSNAAKDCGSYPCTVTMDDRSWTVTRPNPGNVQAIPALKIPNRMAPERLFKLVTFQSGDDVTVFETDKPQCTEGASCRVVAVASGGTIVSSTYSICYDPHSRASGGLTETQMVRPEVVVKAWDYQVGKLPKLAKSVMVPVD